MNRKSYKKLILNGQELEGEELLRYCKSHPEVYMQQIGGFLAGWMSGSAYMEVHTSGSTGKPKLITVEKDQMLASAAATAAFFNFQKNQVALLALPASYIGGKMMIVRALFSSLNLICVKPGNQPLSHLSAGQPVDFVPLTPMQMAGVRDTKNIKTILLGGGPVSTELEVHCRSLNAAVYHGYGMTETLSHVALRRINGAESGSLYTALKGVAFEKNENGCLIIHVPFLNQPVLTNDMVELKSSTSFIWLGRKDNVINSGGIKLFPEQIEAKLSRIIDEPFFVTGVPDVVLGEKLVLLIEGECYSDDQIKTIKEKISDSLTKYEKPKEILFLPHFLRTSSGKIRRKDSLNLVR